MDLSEIAGIPDHVLTNVRTGQMKTYLFKIGDVLSPIKIGTITIPTLYDRTAAMSKAQEIFVLDPLNVVDNSTMGNAQVNGPTTKVNPLGDAQGQSLLIAARRLTNEVTRSDVGIPHPMSEETTPTVEIMNGTKRQDDHLVVLFAVNQDVTPDIILIVADHLDRICPHALSLAS